MIIYKTTNIVNNKIYVGKDSRNIPEYFGSGKLIEKAIKKYGIQNFHKEVIDTAVSIKELNEKEIHWIIELNATDRNIGYNIAKGGDGGDTITNNPNKEHIKKKMSIAQIANTRCRAGKHLSEETKIKLSKKLKGVQFTEERKLKMRVPKRKLRNNSRLGWKYSDEFKKRISDARKLYWKDKKNIEQKYICNYCGIEFISTKKNRKCCSIKCARSQKRTIRN